MKTFGEYCESLLSNIPQEVYVIGVVVFCVGVVVIYTFYDCKIKWRYCLALLLIEYVFLIFCSTVFFRRVMKIRKFDFMPFWSYSKPELLMENIMNIAIFVPIGFLLGVAFRFMTWKRVLVLGVGLSFIIELLQFAFKKGFSEFDDMMHNVLGCVIGYGTSRMIAYYISRKDSHYRNAIM